MIINRERAINELIKTYKSVVKVVDKKAHQSKDRAYGGVVRTVKGQLVEYITEELIKIAWQEVNSSKTIDINSNKIKIPIEQHYIDSLSNNEIKTYIKENIEKYYYGLSVDRHVFIDGKFVLGIECKAYTENAMIKRIMVDFMFLKRYYPNMRCFLFQLESQLGGDYCELNSITYGSHSTHTIMSYFDFPLEIVTFLKGERKVDRPIHKYFKVLSKEKLSEVIDILKNIFIEYK